MIVLSVWRRQDPDCALLPIQRAWPEHRELIKRAVDWLLEYPSARPRDWRNAFCYDTCCAEGSESRLVEAHHPERPRDLDR